VEGNAACLKRHQVLPCRRWWSDEHDAEIPVNDACQTTRLEHAA
jgi:hypothetical protein